MPTSFLTEATLISKISLATSSDSTSKLASSKHLISLLKSSKNLRLIKSSLRSYPNCIAAISSSLNEGLTIKFTLPPLRINEGKALMISLKTDDEKNPTLLRYVLANLSAGLSRQSTKLSVP